MSTLCYANNGSLYENTKATYVPCNITAVENGGHSACCAIGDLCMTNGLCMEAANEAKGANHYWRNGCTDKTWEDPACPNVCRGKEEPGHYNAFIFSCLDPDNKYCCTPEGTLEAGVTGRNTSCCNNEDLTFTDEAPRVAGTASVQLPRVSSVSSSSTSVSSTAEPASTSPMTAASITAIPSPSASSEASSGMSSGAKAGMGVGITLGVLAIVGIIATFFVMRRKKADAYGNNAVLLSDSKTDPPPYVSYESAGTVRAELEGTMLPAEMHHASDKTGYADTSSSKNGPNNSDKADAIAARMM